MKALHSDPGHEAGKRRKATLLGVSGHACEVEDLVGNLRIKFGRCDMGAPLLSGISKATTQGLEPVVHIEAHRTTPPPTPQTLALHVPRGSRGPAGPALPRAPERVNLTTALPQAREDEPA